MKPNRSFYSNKYFLFVQKRAYFKSTPYLSLHLVYKNAHVPIKIWFIWYLLQFRNKFVYWTTNFEHFLCSIVYWHRHIMLHHFINLLIDFRPYASVIKFNIRWTMCTFCFLEWFDLGYKTLSSWPNAGVDWIVIFCCFKRVPTYF